MYCKYCGKKMADDSCYCPSCGRNQDLGINAEWDVNAIRYDDKRTDDVDGAAIILAILGFIIPLIGIIACICYKDKPKAAKTIGIATLVGFIFWLFWWY